jgi:hypothetical protein
MLLSVRALPVDVKKCFHVDISIRKRCYLLIEVGSSEQDQGFLSFLDERRIVYARYELQHHCSAF